MPNPSTTDRKSVTSDPDRGVAVNSGTDPQRPGARPAASPALTDPEKTAPVDRFDATHQPSPAARNEGVEGGGKGEPDDAL
ncbi:MAG TPA: hypothetical protein VFT38_01915 [Vicinamibacteria bacterium]|nr:hypothetical protein [Vicinamibacteria bacterium]